MNGEVTDQVLERIVEDGGFVFHPDDLGCQIKCGWTGCTRPTLVAMGGVEHDPEIFSGNLLSLSHPVCRSHLKVDTEYKDYFNVT